MSGPAFVLVPGAYHTSECWDPVAAALRSRGHLVNALTLPSVGAIPPRENFDADVATIRDAATRFADEGRDVVVVLHSWGGVPGGEAAGAVAKQEREKKGLKGGVVRLVLVMSFIVPEGFQVLDRSKPPKGRSGINVDYDTGFVTTNVEDAKHAFYSDLPDAEAEAWAKKLKHHSIGSFESRTTQAAWRIIPTTYVLCENDQSLPPARAEQMLASAQQSQPNAIDMVEKCDAGHSPFLSQADWFVGVLRRATGEK